MTSIAASPLATATSPASAAGAAGGATSLNSPTVSAPGSDHLAAMRPSIDAANAVGRPTDAAGASSILATGGSYLAGAAQTIARIDVGIAKRTKALEGLRANGGSEAEVRKASEQIDLLQRLRDRIQLSIQRVGDTLAGRDLDGDHDRRSEAEEDAQRISEQRQDQAAAQRRADEQSALEQRLRLLATGAAADLTSGAASAQVAATYREGSGR